MAIFPIEKPPLVVPGCLGWLSAPEIPAGSVATWNNFARSTATCTAAGAAQPVATINQQGALTGVVFNGATTIMTMNSAFYTLPTSSNSLIAVVKGAAGGTQQRIMTIGTGTTTKSALEYTAGGGAVGFSSRNAAGGTVTVGITVDAFNIVACYRNGTTQSIAVNNGTAATNALGADATAVDAATLGGSLSSSVLLNGVIGELMAYPYQLSSDQFLYLIRYLSRRWGIAIS